MIFENCRKKFLLKFKLISKKTFHIKPKEIFYVRNNKKMNCIVNDCFFIKGSQIYMDDIK